MFTPTRMGVPTAPKDTGVLWMIIPAMTAAMPGKPRPTRSGTATAAGVPKPAAPSMKDPNSQAMMITWMRRSEVMSVRPWRMVRSAPLSCRVFRRRMAPKMMKRRVAATMRPFRVAAVTLRTETFQTQRARPAAVR